LLGASSPPILRRAGSDRLADRRRGTAAHRRTLCRRSRDPWSNRRGTPGRSPREKSRPLIEALQPWLQEQLGRISGKSKLAEALRYALARWQSLTRFLDDGRIELDTNTIEREIRSWY
jgi:hypothetical protein